jgi:hypothetical protein
MTESYTVVYEVDGALEYDITTTGLHHEIFYPDTDSVYCFKVYPNNECGSGLTSTRACTTACRKPANLATPDYDITRGEIVLRMDQCEYSGNRPCTACFWDLVYTENERNIIVDTSPDLAGLTIGGDNRRGPG